MTERDPYAECRCGHGRHVHSRFGVVSDCAAVHPEKLYSLGIPEEVTRQGGERDDTGLTEAERKWLAQHWEETHKHTPEDAKAFREWLEERETRRRAALDELLRIGADLEHYDVTLEEAQEIVREVRAEIARKFVESRNSARERISKRLKKDEERPG